MTTTEPKTEYYSLVIEASSPDTVIWLGDDNGHLVQKAVGTLRTDLLPGSYTVEFTLGGTTYPVKLDRSRHLTEQQIRSGPSCPRPAVKLLDE